MSPVEILQDHDSAWDDVVAPSPRRRRALLLVAGAGVIALAGIFMSTSSPAPPEPTPEPTRTPSPSSTVEAGTALVSMPSPGDVNLKISMPGKDAFGAWAWEHYGVTVDRGTVDVGAVEQDRQTRKLFRRYTFTGSQGSFVIRVSETAHVANQRWLQWRLDTAVGAFRGLRGSGEGLQRNLTTTNDWTGVTVALTGTLVR